MLTPVIYHRTELKRPNCLIAAGIAVVVLAGATGKASAQPEERWFQVEVSIFSNEAAVDRAEEQWQAERLNLAYPERMQRLHALSDVLMIDELVPPDDLFPPLSELEQTIPGLTADPPVEALPELPLNPLQILQQMRRDGIAATGPFPPATPDGFRFYDFARDPLVQLPPSESDFQQTNRALERSPEHRLLFHGLWRQPVLDPADARPIYVQGGLAYGDQHELQGTLTIRFNENRDRVVIDTELWLTEFSIIPELGAQWRLPPLPEQIVAGNQRLFGRGDATLVYHPIRIYRMDQSRDMRSTEFHYLDHPALGVVVLVEPYEVPELPLAEEPLR